MEVGQGPNWGCSAKEKKNFIKIRVFNNICSNKPMREIQLLRRYGKKNNLHWLKLDDKHGFTLC
jgi:hypothetical protein